MCGIFGILERDNNQQDKTTYDTVSEKVVRSFMLGQARGPESSMIKQYGGCIVGFHRLAINGLDEVSNQPFINGDLVVTCNGEIYNFKELARENNITLSTNSDCEIILHLYRLFGIEYTLNVLDGVFAFSIYNQATGELVLARDPYGVRPLYIADDDNNNNNNNRFLYASEIKSLYSLVSRPNIITEFTPGSYIIIKRVDNDKNMIYKKYTSFPCRSIRYNNSNNTLTSPILSFDIFSMINEAVRKRVEGTCERPIACLLSGGLDSSLICALVNKYYRNNSNNSNNSNNNDSRHRLETYSIGLSGSEDLKYARQVAEHLGTDHHEIVMTEEDFFNAIPEIIHAIESYDTTTVRASVGNYLVAKWIRQHSEAKVVFNGDGADELMGGYLYFHKAPSATHFDMECKRLLTDISRYDVLRSDRSISANGLEARTPFLDRRWVEFYLSIDKTTRFHAGNGQCEKYLIRKAIQDYAPSLLPSEVLWRTKEAFSDGVSSQQRSWFEIIQERVQQMVENDSILKGEINGLIGRNGRNGINTINIMNTMNTSNTSLDGLDSYDIHNKPTTLEQAYYRYLYNRDYLGCEHTIPYFWMPKFVEANDASARTLDIYRDKVKPEIE